MIYKYNGILLSNKKKNKILPLATMWINLECIILSEVRERQIFCMLPLLCEIFFKKKSILQNRNGLTDIENKRMVTSKEKKGSRGKTGVWG